MSDDKTPEPAQPVTSPLEALRAATVGKGLVFRKRIVKLDENQMEVELRQLSEKKRRNVTNRAKTKASQSAEDGSVSVQMDVAELRVWLVIEMAYVPGTETQVFGPADYESLINQPVGGDGWFGQLADSAWMMFNGMDEALDPKKSEAEKTPS